MDEQEMSLEQLEKLAKNPHYKMSAKQVARLQALRANSFKSNPSFEKHPTQLETNASEHTDDRKTTDSN